MCHSVTIDSVLTWRLPVQHLWYDINWQWKPPNTVTDLPSMTGGRRKTHRHAELCTQFQSQCSHPLSPDDRRNPVNSRVTHLKRSQLQSRYPMSVYSIRTLVRRPSETCQSSVERPAFRAWVTRHRWHVCYRSPPRPRPRRCRCRQVSAVAAPRPAAGPSVAQTRISRSLWAEWNRCLVGTCTLRRSGPAPAPCVASLLRCTVPV